MVPKIIVPLLWAPPVQPLACARLEHRWWGAGTMQVPRAGGTLTGQPLSGSSQTRPEKARDLPKATQPSVCDTGYPGASRSERPVLGVDMWVLQGQGAALMGGVHQQMLPLPTSDKPRHGLRALLRSEIEGNASLCRKASFQN